MRRLHRHAVLRELVVEGLEADPQESRRTALVLAGLVKREEDHLALHLADRCHAAGTRGRPHDVVRQVFDIDEPRAPEHDRALDDVPELTDVAGPVVALQGQLGVRREAADLAVVLAIEFLDEGAGQERNILLRSRSDGSPMAKTWRR